MHTYIKKTGQKEGTNKAELKPNSNNQKQLRDKDLKKTRVHRKGCSGSSGRKRKEARAELLLPPDSKQTALGAPGGGVALCANIKLSGSCTDC